MGRGKNTTLLAVIGVAVMLVALVGATFAYFSISLNTTNNAGIVNVTTTQLSGLILTSDKSEAGTPIYPGWVGYQYVDVYASGASGTSTAYDLSLDVVGSGANINTMLSNVQYAICSITDQSTAASASGFASTTLATATVNSAGTEYSMTGGNVALPASGCTNIVADNATPASGTKISTPHIITVATSAAIAGTKHDQYYIIYRYLDTGSNQNDEMGCAFTVTPVLTPVSS